MHQEDIIILTKKEKFKRNICLIIIILVSFIPSIIFSTYSFGKIKSPDKSDFEYAKTIWNEGLENVTFKELYIDVSDSDSSNGIQIYNGFSKLADTDSYLNITLENGDSLKFKGNKVEVLSRFILGGNTVFYKMDFSKEEIPISRTIMPLIFEIIIWFITGFLGLSVITLIIMVVLGFIFKLLKDNISARKKY